MVKLNNAFAHIKGCHKFLDHILRLKTRKMVYSKTCLGRPLLGRTKCGLSRQVVSEARESR